MIKKTLLVLLALTYLSCGGGGGGGESLSTDACSVLDIGAKIVTGTQCSNENLSIAKIKLLFANGDEGLCTGSFIADTKVLTAAHCFLAGRVGSAVVTLGASSAFATEVQLHPEAQIVTPLNAVFNDVAILTVPAAFDVDPLPIILSSLPKSGDVISVFGFGIDENGELLGLRSGEMKLSSVTNDHLSAAYDGSGSNVCNGDSGGPAIALVAGSPGLIGVVSSGIAQARCLEGDISLFANLQNQKIIDFIQQNVPTLELK